MSYYVLRTHSWTDRQRLWKVMSRPFTDFRDANSWMEFCKSEEKNKNHEFFVVARDG